MREQTTRIAELPPSADPPDPTLSADGAYRVETDFIVAEDGIRQYETRLVDTATDAVLARRRGSMTNGSAITAPGWAADGQPDTICDLRDVDARAVAA